MPTITFDNQSIESIKSSIDFKKNILRRFNIHFLGIVLRKTNILSLSSHDCG